MDLKTLAFQEPEEALKELLTKAPNKENEVKQLFGQLERVRRLELLGIESSDNIKLEWNRITYSILQLVDQVGKEPGDEVEICKKVKSRVLTMILLISTTLLVFLLMMVVIEQYNNTDIGYIINGKIAFQKGNTDKVNQVEWIQINDNKETRTKLTTNGDFQFKWKRFDGKEKLNLRLKVLEQNTLLEKEIVPYGITLETSSSNIVDVGVVEFPLPKQKLDPSKKKTSINPHISAKEQLISISGTVTRVDRKIYSGVKVYFEEIQMETFTDENGNFNLNIPKDYEGRFMNISIIDSKSKQRLFRIIRMISSSVILDIRMKK